MRLVVEVAQETNASAVQYDVKFAAGMQLMGLEGLTLGVVGEVSTSSSEPWWLTVYTVEPWQALPMLAVPQFEGNFKLYPDSTVVVSAEASMDEWVIVPSFLEARDVYVSIDVAPFNFSD